MVSGYLGTRNRKGSCVVRKCVVTSQVNLISDITDLQEEYNCEDVLLVGNYEDKIFPILSHLRIL